MGLLIDSSIKTNSGNSLISVQFLYPKKTECTVCHTDTLCVSKQTGPKPSDYVSSSMPRHWICYLLFFEIGWGNGILSNVIVFEEKTTRLTM